MAEHTTVFITDTTPGVGTRTYTDSGRKTSVDVDSLTANTEYIATAEYERPDGVTIQTVQGVTFRTLVAGTFAISNEQWVNNNDGLTSTVTFNFTSTYAISSIILQDNGVQGSPQYQCSISGNTATATLPYYSPGTQHAMAFLMMDIYAETASIGRILTLQVSPAGAPLYFELINTNIPLQVYLTRQSSPTITNFQYSYDNSTWSDYAWDDSTFGEKIQLNSSNPKVYFRNKFYTSSLGNSNGRYEFAFNVPSGQNLIDSRGNVKLGGNIAFLKSVNGSDNQASDYDFWDLFMNTLSNFSIISDASDLYLGNYDTLAPYCFREMFAHCKDLIYTPNLPATTLANNCYMGMFEGCISLTTTPTISATTLANNCCSNMFKDCTSLTTISVPPATTLAEGCYYEMFYGCTALTTAPTLPATTLAEGCYNYMFRGCTSLINPPTLPATTLDVSCYYHMFSGCTALTTTPALPATTLANQCYQYMFENCTSLTRVSSLPATTLASQCYADMFYGCTSLTQAPSLPATTLARQCYQGMFWNCTALTQAPDLLVETLTNRNSSCYANMFQGCTSLVNPPVIAATRTSQSCFYSMFKDCTSLIRSPKLIPSSISPSGYKYMFQGCSSLREITCLATSFYDATCTTDWVSGVAATGIFYKSPNMTSWPTGDSGIPSGWTVIDYQN